MPSTREFVRIRNKEFDAQRGEEAWLPLNLVSTLDACFASGHSSSTQSQERGLIEDGRFSVKVANEMLSYEDGNRVRVVRVTRLRAQLCNDMRLIWSTWTRAITRPAKIRLVMRLTNDLEAAVPTASGQQGAPLRLLRRSEQSLQNPHHFPPYVNGLG